MAAIEGTTRPPGTAAGTGRRDAERAPEPAEDRWSDIDEIMWRAVVERDRAFDDAFFCAVASTGVYCRPSCPSRRPKRDNVSFFPTAAAAAAAGFRPCRRCHPERPGGGDPLTAKVLAACRHIEQREDGVPTLAELGELVGMSPAHFQRLFKRAVGVSPKAYADGVRSERFRRLLRNGDRIAPALYEAGYGSSSRLYEKAAERLGMTPGAYGRGGTGERIAYAVLRSALGLVLVAATARGICAVRLGESERELEADLRAEFRGATLVAADERVAGWAQALIDYLDGTADWPELPYDVRATAFQLRVWEALRRIPSGATATYGDIARMIGQPKGARAVGRACATNPVALVVPCHRIVPKEGGTGEYGWGADRKRRLLAIEAGRTAAMPSADGKRGRPKRA